MEKLNEKGFNAALATIKKQGEAMAQCIHDAACFALMQANQHGNIGFATRLIDAMGKKHDVKRVEKWFCHFGKFGMKQSALVYRARRDILPENIDAKQAEAEACPYWELTAQEHHKVTFNGLSALASILTSYQKALAVQAEGKPVTITNDAVVKDIKALLDKYSPTATPA